MTKKTARKTLTHAQVIKRLQLLADVWPQDLTLWSASGALLVVNDDNVVLDDIIGIPNDGGDPDIIQDADGNLKLSGLMQNLSRNLVGD